MLLVPPGGVQVVDGLLEVVGGGVDGRAVAGPGEGDVGELATSAGSEDVGTVVGGALRAVDGDGVRVVEVGGVEHLADEDDLSVVVVRSDEHRLGADCQDAEPLAGDHTRDGVGSQGDHAVTGGVGRPPGIVTSAPSSIPIVSQR